MENQIQRVQAALVDGRSRTPRFIQKQLKALHDALVQAAPSIHQAILHDTACPSSEAWFEICLTLRAVKQNFAAIDFQETLKQEYSLSDGKNNENRRTAYGCVYIVPWQYSRFYSTIQPIAAAIAAGNCVVVEIKKTILEVDRLVRELLHSVMDKDTFAFVDQRPSSTKFFNEQVVVVDASNQMQLPQSSRLLDLNLKRVIAVVDRSANIAEAARHIIRARFRFGGKSVYAPDMVFVNEFALNDFCRAAVRSMTEELSESIASNGTAVSQASPDGDGLHKILRQIGTTTLVSGARGSIYLLQHRHDSILNRKNSEPILIINPTTSLDDAIDTANRDTSLLAAYLFADPAAAKYLSQFIASDASFTNHIPPQLLIGPPAPASISINPTTRFTTEMFSKPNPEFINPTSDEESLIKLLDGPSSKPTLDKLRADIEAPLPDMDESITTTVGFFEQGLFTGLAVEATVLFGVLGICARYAVPAVLKRFRG